MLATVLQRRNLFLCSSSPTPSSDEEDTLTEEQYWQSIVATSMQLRDLLEGLKIEDRYSKDVVVPRPLLQVYSDYITLLAHSCELMELPYLMQQISTSIDYFSLLSDELLLKIFCYLSWRDLFVIRQVSKTFFRISMDKQLWHVVCTAHFGGDLHSVWIGKDWEWICKSKENMLSTDVVLIERFSGVGCLYSEHEIWGESVLKYEGDFMDGKRVGKGVCYWDDGSRYEGDWRDDKREGFGFITFGSGSWYQGQWKNGKREGQGEYVWSSGARYRGGFSQGLKHGRGFYSFPDGTRYEGEYQNGKKHGKGIFYYANGTKREGVWVHGKIQPEPELEPREE